MKYAAKREKIIPHENARKGSSIVSAAEVVTFTKTMYNRIVSL